MPKIPIRFEFVITTIDVIEVGCACPLTYGKDAKVVELHGRIQSKKNDNDVAFLLNLKSTKIFGVDDENKVIVYQGIKVSKRVFQYHLLAHKRKFLACIHGYSVEPETFLPRYVFCLCLGVFCYCCSYCYYYCLLYFQYMFYIIFSPSPFTRSFIICCNFSSRCAYMQTHQSFWHTLIPIVWPSIDIPPMNERSPIDEFRFYRIEKRITYQAGKALKAIGDLGTRISLSLMAHSMGNRVFMSYVKHAAVEKRFEAIFLVAADIWEEVFNTRVIENKLPFWNCDNEWADTGLKMCKMLKRGGKIHIFRYKRDKALIASALFLNCRQRLGVHGKPCQEARNRIHKDCKDKLVDVNMAKFAGKIKKFHNDRHCYHIMPETITYYNNVMRKA
jgi:hypothetical protein